MALILRFGEEAVLGIEHFVSKFKSIWLQYTGACFDDVENNVVRVLLLSHALRQGISPTLVVAKP